MILLVYIFIDGYPFVIKQTSWLTWKRFNMYKFRTMKNNSHELREIYEDLNKNDGPFLKLKMIPEY